MCSSFMACGTEKTSNEVETKKEEVAKVSTENGDTAKAEDIKTTESTETNQEVNDNESGFDYVKDTAKCEYEVTKEKYTQNDDFFKVEIEYPKLKSDTIDGKKLDKINEALKNEAIKSTDLKKLEKMNKKDSDKSHYDIEVKCDVKTSTNNFISVQYNGMCNAKEAFHPTNICDNINYDITNDNVLTLADVTNVETVGNKIESGIRSINVKETLGDISGMTDEEVINMQVGLWKENSTEEVATGNNFYVSENKLYFVVKLQVGAGCFYDVQIKQDYEKY